MLVLIVVLASSRNRITAGRVGGKPVAIPHTDPELTDIDQPVVTDDEYLLSVVEH